MDTPYNRSSIAFVILAILTFASSAAQAVTISVGTYEFGSRSTWLETIEGEGAGVTVVNGGAYGSPSPAWAGGAVSGICASVCQPNSIATTFSVASNTLLVQFQADGNDGLADFIVDNVSVGTYNTVNAGWIQIVISGLSNIAHTIKVAGLPNPTNGHDDLAIDVFGAINTQTVVPVPAAFPLFGTGLAVLGFLGWRRRRKAI
ncbi:MAG: PEP-CTERM sorting domain-containing protein [bacterium]|nr:PEP-CTERM sorting domain-containing protein [bacterium]